MKNLLLQMIIASAIFFQSCHSEEIIPPVDHSNGVNTAKQLDRLTKDLSVVDSIIIYNNKNSSILKLGKAKPVFYEYYMLVNEKEIDLTYALVTSFGPKYVGDFRYMEVVIYIKEPIPYTPIRR
ncbi:hypothetical protein QM480_13920 [Flectobacillus sp. DC10W]|uniref:Uncharacterized protein n=1 Tax=Flectobacillus longus TaxID=2984207 RepID=A0ABT6YPS1_9BACT|nr:hypothetical protein [Flectobacillus longus]MDI9865434.1 hypothetical protein [Flectobacillus longus]